MDFSESKRSGWIDPEEIRALGSLQSSEGPVFSLYLDLRGGDAWRRFDALLADLRAQKKIDGGPVDKRQQWEEEAEQLRLSLKRVLGQNSGQGAVRGLEQANFDGPGLAVISSAAGGIARVYALPAAVADRLVVGPQAFTRPIEVLLEEFGCTLVVLVDDVSARLVRVFGNRAEEVENVGAVPVTGEHGDEIDTSEHIRAAVMMAEAAWEEQPCARLIIGGSPELVSELRSGLHGMLREELEGGADLSTEDGVEEIIRQVRAVEAEEERRLEARRVQELMEAVRNQGSAALGLEQTMLVVRSKKARMLVVEEDFHLEGGVCPNCGYMGEWEQGVCLLCESALRPEVDIIEAAAARVIALGGKVEVLRSEAWRNSLEEFGRIGALLSDPGAVPTERDAANRRPLVQDGEINRDVLHDEAMEESFPASDSPSF